MTIKWKKNPGDLMTANAGPFTLKVQPQGDGRWSWSVFKEDTPNPTATGIAGTLNGAKTVIEQYVARTGLV